MFKLHKHLGRALLLAIAFSLSAHAELPQTPDFIGQSGFNVYRIDEAGTGTLIGQTGGLSTNAMARDSTGVLWSSDSISGAGQLYTIDQLTGLGTVQATVPDAQGLRGMAFDAADNLFAIKNNSSGDDFLVRIDLGTSLLTTVGETTGFSALQGLAFAPNGRLYGWDVFRGLVTIDTTTAATTDVNSNVGGTGNIQALTFAPDGRLFGGRDQVFEIDRLTGESTLIGGSNFSDLRGLEFIPTLPPICDIQLNQSMFVDGETVMADVLRLGNPNSSSLAIEWALWLEGFPGGAISVVNTGADGSVVLPAGFETDLGPLVLLGVTAAIPRGDYEFSCRIVNPITKRLLVEDLNLFTIQ